MATQILATKLYIPPPRPKTVSRQRLIGRLHDGLAMGCKLTLISAPAGFGKTTLLSDWVAGFASPVAWLALDEGDNDRSRFLTYLIAALETIAPNIGKGELAAIPSSQTLQTEAILTALINEIATIPGNFVLVLDDYHVLDSEPIHHALDFLLEHLPPQMHLVIATREDPQLPLARYRARGLLTELRAADLRFTPVEAAEFLNEGMGLTLAPEDIAALETRTEGWIAGLQMAALSMQGVSDATRFIESFTGSHRFVLDYLIEEVLSRQPENIQSFLLRTSILGRLCGPLCDAVLSSPSASGQATLEYLERANLFIIPLDQERRWYRYHHLFAELLRQRLGQPQELSDYHLRASAWFERNGDLAEAFHHALTAGEFGLAARLAEDAWQEMDRSFQTAAWIGWVKKLPDAVICSRPRLCFQLGSAYMDAGEPETSEIYLQHAERAMAGASDQGDAKVMAGNIALIRASNAQNLGDLAGTVKYADLALRLIPEDDVYARASAAITLEFTHWTTGNLEASLRGMYAWIEEMQRLGKLMFAIASAFAVADMLVIMGRLEEAEKALQLAIQQAALLGQEAESVTAHHHLGLALLAHERGDHQIAAEHLRIASDLGKMSTLVDWPYRWNMAQARLKESAGEWDVALELFDQASRVYVKNPIPMLQPVEAHKARVYLKQGRLGKAQAWAQGRDISIEDEVRYLDEYNQLTLARLRLAEGSFAGVSDLLERLLALAEAQKRTGSVIEILLTQALVHQAQANHPKALAAFEHALALAQPECYLRTFVDEGEPMRLLILDFKTTIEKQGRPNVHHLFGYANKLLAAFPDSMQAIPQSRTLAPHAQLPRMQVPGSAGVTNPNSKVIEPLTDRELEILHLIAEGHSNAEIGKRLYLALSTVKGHNLRIFNKLQVQNRTEAVARARELRLL